MIMFGELIGRFFLYYMCVVDFVCVLCLWGDTLQGGIYVSEDDE